MGIFNIWGNRSVANESSPEQQGRGSSVDSNKPSPIAIIYRSEFDVISRFILDYPNIETGGQLFGYWTSTGTPVVMYAIGPGRNARHHATSFVQDWDYLQSVGKELHKRYRLQHIGEWHSHHQLGLAHPSGGDVNTMSYGVGKPGFPRLLLCIGNCTPTTTTLNAFNFHENMPGEYIHAAWDIVEMESPYRRIIDVDLQRAILHPFNKRASHGQIHSIRNTVRETESIKMHWLTENTDNVETMKTFVSMVQSMYPRFSVKTEILDSGEPQIVIKDVNVCIKFPYGFPAKSPVLTNEAGERRDSGVAVTWEIGEEALTTSFGRWLTANLLPLVQPEQAMTDDDFLYSQASSPITEDQEREYKEAATRTERVGLENQVLSNYFHPDAVVWSEITDNPVVHIIAYPFTNQRQGAIRMTLLSNFPNVPPEVQYGFYDEEATPNPTFRKHLSEIEYKDFTSITECADDIYLGLLKWEPETSIFKAYIIACIMLFYSSKAQSLGLDVMGYYNELLEDEQKLTGLVNKIEQEIKDYKEYHYGLSTQTT